MSAWAGPEGGRSSRAGQGGRADATARCVGSGVPGCLPASRIRASGCGARCRRLAALVAADLAANAGWCWLFFKRRSPAGGLAGIVVLDALNVELLRQAARRDTKAATALAPYVAWTLFATVLNADIWLRNR